MSETIVLDPNEEVPDRFEFDITPYIGAAGPDFGEAAVEAFFADADLGQVPLAYNQLNRIVVIPLVLHGRTGRTFDELRSMLQAKVGLWQREGGVIKRETSIGPVYADIADARLKLGGSTAQAMQEVDVDAVLSLECIPDWYGPEIDLDSETGAGELARIVDPAPGDHPGRVRIVVTDGAGKAQRGCLWSIRFRHYSADATAASVIEAEDMTPMDAASVATLAGASGGGSNNVIEHDLLGVDWTPVVLTDLDASGALTHVGSYRVFARCHTTSNPPPRVRLVWNVGALFNPEPNTPVIPPGSGSFFLLDLGEIRLDPSPVGTHSWQGQIQGSGQNGGENLSIDKVWLFALDDYSGRLRAPTNVEIGLQDYAARDSFNQTAGTLHGVTAPIGGAWTTTGDTGDFNIDDGGHNLFRGVTTDSGVLGRSATLGSAMTTMAVRGEVMFPAATGVGLDPGILLRYVDANNFVALILHVAGSGIAQPRLWKVIGGSVVSEIQPLLDAGLEPMLITSQTWYVLQGYIDADGNALAWVGQRGAALGAPLIAFQDADLAVGGTLASGKAGLYAFQQFAQNAAWDNFAAWIPEPDAVIHPSLALEIRTDGIFREDPTADGYSPVRASGNLPRLPAGGLEARPVEVLVKPTRGDIDSLPDSSPDDAFDVQVLYRPSYLYVPDGGHGS